MKRVRRAANLGSLGSLLLLTEDDFELLGGGAVAEERGAILGESVGGGASLLEELGLAGRLAGAGAVILVTAAELVRAQGHAPALAADQPLVWRLEMQLRRAGGQEISPAAHHGADPLPLVGSYRHRHVEPVHQANAVGGLVQVAGAVEGELRESRRRGAAQPGALQAPAAVAGVAGEAAAAAVVAAGAAPHATAPGVGGRPEGAVAQPGQLEPASFQDRVPRIWLDRRPESVRAVIHYGEQHRRVLRRYGCQQEEEDDCTEQDSHCVFSMNVRMKMARRVSLEGDL